MKHKSMIAIVGVLCFLVPVMFAGCDSPVSPDDPDPDSTDEEQDDPEKILPSSQEVFAELLDLLAEIDFDGNPVEEILAMEDGLQEARDGFDAVLQSDANDPLANVGVAVLIVVQRAYADPFDHFLSTQLWSDLDEMLEGDPAPFDVLDLLWPDSVRSIGAIQDELGSIDDALAEAVSHLAVAVEHFDDPIEIEIIIDGGNDDPVRVVLDQPEIEVFQAAAAAARIPIIMAQIYDFEVYDNNDDPIDLPEFLGTLIELGMDEQFDEIEEQFATRALNALRSETFLTRRAGGPSPGDARTVLIEALTAAKSAHEGLMKRDFEADDYLIPGEELPEEILDEINEDLENLGITEEITGLADLAYLLIEMVNGNTVLTLAKEDLELEEDLEINIGAFFDYDDDLREWLPERSLFDDIDDTQEPDEIAEALFNVFMNEGKWPDLTFGGIFDPEIELPQDEG